MDVNSRASSRTRMPRPEACRVRRANHETLEKSSIYTIYMVVTATV